MFSACRVSDASVNFYTIPTDSPEADGTFHWDSTSMVFVELQCGGVRALGYTYADHGTAVIAAKLVKDLVTGSNPFEHAQTRQQMMRQIRNMGETGAAMMAISAIDNALWTFARVCSNCPW